MKRKMRLYWGCYLGVLIGVVGCTRKSDEHRDSPPTDTAAITQESFNWTQRFNELEGMKRKALAVQDIKQAVLYAADEQLAMKMLTLEQSGTVVNEWPHWQEIQKILGDLLDDGKLAEYKAQLPCEPAQCTELEGAQESLRQNLLALDQALPKSLSYWTVVLELNFDQKHEGHGAVDTENGEAMLLKEAYGLGRAALDDVRLALGSQPWVWLGPKEGSKNEVSGGCKPELSSMCEDLKAELAKLVAERKDLLDRGEWLKIEPAVLEQITYDTELIRLLEGGKDLKDPLIEELTRQFRNLNLIHSQGFAPYSPEEYAEVRKVFDQFGPLILKLSPRTADGKLQAFVLELPKETPKPWSGYWYPAQKNEMFGSPDAPLAKFDQVLKELNIAERSVDWEAARYTPYAADWAGLCDAWAMAALSVPEPIKPVSYRGVVFNVSDLKALLIKKFEGAKATIYGQRYLGTAETDGQMQDLRPEAFHRLVEVILGEKKMALGVDDDSGPEIWNKPLISMRWTVEPDPNAMGAYLVKAYPKLVQNRSSVSEKLTDLFDIKAPVYTYRLFVDPDCEASRMNESGCPVVYGQWLDQSLDNHPDLVFIPGFTSLSTVIPKNKILAKYNDILNAIIAQGRN